jgi:mRNA interferase RelE/StbE
MNIIRTNRFKRAYKKLDPQSQKIIKKALEQLINDFSNPSLRIKKMGGYKNPYVWEASANMDLRITFEIEKPDTLILRNCGHHNETLNNP